MSKRILFFILFSWLASAAFPAFAQQKTDTVYTFRFVPQKDMFYVPWNGNDTELARLLECIENNKAIILDGKMPLLVDTAIRRAVKPRTLQRRRSVPIE